MMKLSRHNSIAAIFYASGVAAVYFCINYNWLKQYRFGGLLDIDEAGYTSMAVNLARQLIGGGISNWFHAFSYPNIQAPLSYGSASILMYYIGFHEYAGLITNAIFGSLTIFFTFLLAKRVSSIPVALITSIIVFTNPYFTAYARNFEFAAASSASCIALIYFFNLSNGLSKITSSLLFGACSGLFLLSRTVNISYVPGITLASVVFILLTNKHSWLIITRNALIAAVVAVIVAGPWYYINIAGIMQYLFSYGYGSHASEYAVQTGERLSILIAHADTLFRRMLLPHMILLAALSVTYLGAAVINYRVFFNDKRVLFSAYLLLLYLLCFGTLLTSDNMGSGFDVPLIAVLTVGLITGLANLLKLNGSNTTVGIVLAALCLLIFVPQASDDLCHKIISGHQIPAQGTAALSCGGTIRSYFEQGGGFDKLGDLVPHGDRLNREIEKKWIVLNEAVTKKIFELNPQNKPVIFTNRHIVLNGNTSQLWAIVNKGSFIPIGALETGAVPDSVDGYKLWLTQNAAACLFLANTKKDGQFPPAASYEYLQEAFKEAGLEEAACMTLPDGHQSTVFWIRPEACK